jgi:hypothetical protein
MNDSDVNDSWGKNQCDARYNELFKDQLARNGFDSIKAHSTVKALNPRLMARKIALSNALIARDTADGGSLSLTPVPGTIPQPGLDTRGLYQNADMDEFSQVWKKCGNSCDPSLADVGFDVLVSFNARRGSGDAQAAAANVRTRFPALSTLADGIKASRKLGADLPGVNTGKFGAGTGYHDYSIPRQPTSASAVERSKTGLGVFDPARYAVPNAQDEEASWDQILPLPLTDHDRVLVKYIVAILSRLDPPAGSLDYKSLVILNNKLAAPSSKEVADAADASALGNCATALANSNEKFLMISDAHGWRFAT